MDVRRGGFTHDSYRATFAGDFDSAVAALLAYRVFPPRRMHARVCTADGQIAVGPTIVQRIRIGPAVIETAVRIIELERSADRVHFAYATLRGHAERGVASFSVVRGSSTNRFEAEAWSRAGHWLTSVGRPLSRLLQRRFTREAVESFCGSIDCAG